MANQLTEDQMANLSDDEMMNLDLGSLAFNSSEEIEEEQGKTTEEVDAGKPSEEETQKADDGEQKQAEEAGENDPEAGEGVDAPNGDAGDPVVETKADEGKGQEAPKDEPANGQPVGTASATPAAPDLTAFHAAITSKFKANGREMQVQTAEEALQLMQMGANYNKKMAGLKPNLTLLRMLEKADLLSEEKLSFLIDLVKKNPEAINKLVKDSGIDPLDITAEKAGDYKPGNYRITDEEQALDEVFESLQGAEGFDRTLQVVDKEWDKASRALIAQNPKALIDITKHVAAGAFDLIQAEVDRERVLGRLTGLSDLEAYRQVGIAMSESGKLKHLTEKATPPSQPTAPAKVVVESKPKQAEDANLRKQRQAASPSRASAPSGKGLPADFNPLAMSDEEIMNMDFSKLK